MSFRSAYQSFKSSSQKSRSGVGLFRDPTPEQWKKTMDEYYIREQNRKTDSNAKRKQHEQAHTGTVG